MIALIVTIQIKPEHREAFMESMFGDARGSNNDEPGCLRFDVLQDSEDPNRIFLYECSLTHYGYLDLSVFSTCSLEMIPWFTSFIIPSFLFSLKRSLLVFRNSFYGFNCFYFHNLIRGQLFSQASFFLTKSKKFIFFLEKDI